MTSTPIEPIYIGSKPVGDGHPIYIMADLGLTNGGDQQRSFDLIDIAHEIGIDAVKFQMIGPEVLLGDKSAEYTYPTVNDGSITENMYEMFSRLSYTEEQWHEIANYARAKGLDFICTAHYIGAVPILDRIGVNIHKICTWSVTHKRLLQSIGKTRKPLMVDTGASTTRSLGKTLDWYVASGGRGVVILHDFHTADPGEMNFNAIPFMKRQFGYPVGYTPQGRDFDMDFMAVGLGVNVLEKRLTIDRTIPENGHIKALEKAEFSDWLERFRNLEVALGRADVLPTASDLEQSRRFFKSLYLTRGAKQGEIITDDILEARRPGTGIPASEIDGVVGRRLLIDADAETMIDWGILE